MVEAEEENCDIEASHTKSDHEKPAPTHTQTSEAPVGAGSSISLLTPQPNDFILDVCEGQGSHSGEMGNPDHDPGGLAVRDETQQSS